MASRLPFGSWVISPKPNTQAGMRLFCFPYAGGGASCFFTWPESLPSTVEVCAIQLPGRENRARETAFTQLSTLLQVLGDALIPYLDKPFAFFGHSMGALICFELARYLRRQYALSPLQLFVSAYHAPQLLPEAPSLHALSQVELIEKLRRFHGTPEAVLQSEELMQLILPMLKADFTLCESYRYIDDEPFSLPFSVFGGLQDDTVSYDALQGWHDQTRGRCLVRMFPGNHFFLRFFKAQLLQSISRDLNQLQFRREFLG